MAKNVQNSHFFFRRNFYLSGKYAVTKFATSLSGGTLPAIFPQKLNNKELNKLIINI